MNTKKQSQNGNAATGNNTGANRRGPKPLNLHLFTTACMLSAAAIPWVSDPQQKQAALDAVRDLTQGMMAGLEAYKASDIAPQKREYSHIWEEGSSRLLHVRHNTDIDAPPVLLVPSLINRHDILDLDPNHSFAVFLAEQGFAPFILDWGQPDTAERAFTLNDYITKRLVPALQHLHAQYGAVHVTGYCMGGTLAAGALATLDDNAELVRSLTLLAAPWDFHAGDKKLATRMSGFLVNAQPVMDATGLLPVDWIQAMVSSVDPLFAFNKFRAFASMKPDSAEARRFIIVEDWLNDGVDLAAPSARQALQEWYVDNQPINGVWTIGSKLVDPAAIKVPTLVVAASNDKLVPKASALAIVQQIAAADTLTPDIGHIGMMASPRALATVWEPVAKWLQDQTSKA